MSLLAGYRSYQARTDPARFAAHVLRDETSGAPIKLAPHHRAMHRLWSKHGRCVVLSFAEAGKTSQLIARIAWELARNSNLRIGFVAGTLSQAERVVRAVKQLIEGPEFQMLFPGRAVTSREGSLTLDQRTTSAKDPSLVPAGLGLGSTLGQRFDLVIGDDLLDLESTRTAFGRDSAWSALLKVHLSRLAPGGRVWLSGTAWHSDDCLARAAKLDGWASAKFPVSDEQGRSAWPERWPSERIAERRIELGPIPFGCVMLCNPIDASTLVFTAEMLDQALLLGRTPHLSPIGGRGIVAVDPAWTTGPQSDESGIVLVSIDSAGFRHVVHVEGLKVHHDRLADRVVELARANNATVYCEDNGAGGLIAAAIGRRAPCKPLNTNATSKRARVEALSAEMASRRWVFSQPLGQPSPELRRLVDELGTFSFESHAGDRASALLIACEGARRFESRPKGRCFEHNLLRR